MRAFKYLSLHLWIGIAWLVFNFYDSRGLPHVIVSYTFLDIGDQFNPLAERTHLTCTFAGPYGAFKVPAEDGRCSWVRMFRDEG